MRLFAGVFAALLVLSAIGQAAVEHTSNITTVAENPGGKVVKTEELKYLVYDPPKIETNVNVTYSTRYVDGNLTGFYKLRNLCNDTINVTVYIDGKLEISNRLLKKGPWLQFQWPIPGGYGSN